MRRAKVYMNDDWAGTLTESDEGYRYTYRDAYLKQENATSISATLPIQEQEFRSKILFPFFDGLIPEGWLLDIVEKNWKLDERDRMGILLVACQDCIGAVSIHPYPESES